MGIKLLSACFVSERPGDLIFIIDLSESMSAELQALQESIMHLTFHTTAVERLQKTFDRFIVVAFSDPYVEVQVAKNVRDLRKVIEHLKPRQQGNCPQPIYESIIEAINAAQSNSVALLMTNASPKNPDLYLITKQQARKKRITLIANLFGNCGPNFAANSAQLIRLSFELGGRSYLSSTEIQEVMIRLTE